jgi:hypothetical protein
MRASSTRPAPWAADTAALAVGVAVVINITTPDAAAIRVHALQPRAFRQAFFRIPTARFLHSIYWPTVREYQP